VPNQYSAGVRGTYGTLPRGYPWVMLAWYAVMAALVPIFMVHSWVGIVAGLVVFGSGGLIVRWLRIARPAVFSADADGIRLGRDRHCILLPWRDIQEIRISPTAVGAGGVTADLIMSSGAHVATSRVPPAAEVLLALIPGSFLFLTPPLVTPLAGHARYRAPLWGTTPSEVADALRHLAPTSVQIVT